ncbi:MAG: tetratricopeptide repeat protein [Capsulimonadaceae bacterium]
MAQRRGRTRTNIAQTTKGSTLRGPGHNGVARARLTNTSAAAYLPPALLTALTVLVFAASCRYTFVGWDDPVNITSNPHINGTGPIDIRYFWTHTFTHTYRPLIFTYWGLVAAIAGMPSPVTDPALGTYQVDPHIFHAAGLVLHLVNAGLVYFILVRLVKMPWAAFAGAAVFAIHPLQVGSVVWITGANAALNGLFTLLTIGCWLRFAEPCPEAEGVKSEPVLRFAHGSPRVSSQLTRDPSRPDSSLSEAFTTPGQDQEANTPYGPFTWYAAATVTFVLALLTYPMAVAIPLIVLALDRWFGRRPIRQALAALAPWFLLSIGWAAFTASVRDIAQVPIHSPIVLRPFVAGDALAFYLEKLVLPWALAPDYGRTPDYVTRTHYWAYATWLVPVAVGWVIWRVRKQQPGIALGAVVFGAALLPVLGLVTNAFQMYSTVSDRYMYVALFGVAIAVAAVFRACVESAPRPTVGVTSIVLVSLGALTICHAADYRDWQALYRHTIDVNPRSAVSAYNIGVVDYKMGNDDEAIRWFRRAIAARPDYDEAYNDLGAALSAEGRFDDAIAAVTKAVAVSPHEARWRYSLGEVDIEAGRPADAVNQFTACLALDRHLPGAKDQLILAYNHLGASLVQQHKLDAAVANWRQALTVSPGIAILHDNLGAVYLMQHDRTDAAAQFQAVLSIAPADSTARAGLAAAASR